MTSASQSEWSLRDGRGRRKYLTASERWRFLDATEAFDRDTAALCALLAFTGCRISEALAIRPSSLDEETCSVVFRTLKRRRLAYRAVPIPAELMKALLPLAMADNRPLWVWCRVTAWRRVKSVMLAAGISGHQAMPKGLRHGFGVACASQNVPIGLTARLMGHARIETTVIYQDVIGAEERELTSRVWARPRAEVPPA